jgi:hypothetical protein
MPQDYQHCKHINKANIEDGSIEIYTVYIESTGKLIDVCEKCYENSNARMSNSPDNRASYVVEIDEWNEKIMRDITFTVDLHNMTKVRLDWIMALVADVGTGDLETYTYVAGNPAQELTEAQHKFVTNVT